MKGHKAHHHAEHGHHGVVHKGVHHHHPRAAHAKGGKAGEGIEAVMDHDEAPKEVYAGAGSHVVHEAEEHKRGGKAKKKKIHLGHAEGHKSEHRADRKPRKSGGRAGSNMNPLSSAHHGMEPKGRHEKEID